MPRANRGTGEGDEYTASEEEAVAEAIAEAYAYWDEEGHEGEPNQITVEATIEWAGEVDAKNGGMRGTKLDGLSTDAMRKVREATQNLSTARQQAADDPHKVTQALTTALRERYGSTIRFRNIRRLDF